MGTKQRPTEEAYAELQQAYDFFNTELFGGQLPACLLTFQRQKKTMGYFHRNRFVRKDGGTTDEIALNPAFFPVVPLIEVLQTIVHEQTHQWQDHFGKPSRSCYHNKEWGEKMEAIGLMPSSTGMPGGKRTGQCVMDYPIEGGLFERATRKLIESGFAITWHDRYPEAPPAKYSPAMLASIQGNGLIHNDADPADAGAAVSMSLHTSRPDLFTPIQTESKSNRDKYSCPECGLNAWGKPGLRLICADCSELLTTSVE